MNLWDYILKKTSPKFREVDVKYARHAAQDQVKLYSQFRDQQQALLYLGACSNAISGYTRERALKEMAKLKSAGLVQYVLPRLGDWVPQVRDQARVTLDKLVQAGYGGELIDHLDLIENLSRIQRVDLTIQIKKLQDLIQSPDLIDTLIKSLDHDHVSKRRYCYKVLVQKPEFHQMLTDRALKDPDPAIRLCLVRAYLNGEVSLCESTQLALIKDPSSMVSVTMVRSFSDDRVRAMEDTLVDLATSSSPPIRRESSFLLTRKCNFDVVGHARALVGTMSSSGVLELLGELGGQEDIPSIVPFVSHGNPRVRRAAIASIGMLTKDQSMLQVFLDAIQDSNKKVRRAAFMALAKRSRSWWYEQVYEIFLREQSVVGYRAGHLLATLSGWDSVPVALVLLQEGQPEDLSNSGMRMLIDWSRRQGLRGWIRPSPFVVEQIAAYWPKVERERKMLHWQKWDWVEIQTMLDGLISDQNGD